MQTLNAQDVVQSYLDAFGAQDLARCVDLFCDDATLFAPPVTYQGKQALEDWHRARFNANARIVRIDDVSAQDDVVTVQGAITSKRLKAWRINTLAGRATFKMRGDKIADVRFEPAGWKHFLGGASQLGVFRTQRDQDR